MLKSRFFCGGSALAVSVALALGAQDASAQQTAQKATDADAALAECLEAATTDAQRDDCAKEDATRVAEVVSTGSFISGVTETAALPVTLITFEEIQNMGTPSNNELIRSLSEMGGVQGETYRLDNDLALGGGIGAANLRNMSSGRTVVLMNGRRMATEASSGPFTGEAFVNTNLIPNAAIQQVEMLKDGGTTTYGADAVGGVVNFITRRNVNGFELRSSYKFVKDSDGDYDVNLTWGKVGDFGNVLVIGTFAQRSELNLYDRDFANTDYLQNPQGQWTSWGSPGAYLFQYNQQSGFVGFNNPSQGCLAGTGPGLVVGGSTTVPCIAASTLTNNGVRPYYTNIRPAAQFYQSTSGSPRPAPVVGASYLYPSARTYAAGTNTAVGTYPAFPRAGEIAMPSNNNVVNPDARAISANGIVRDPQCSVLGGFAAFSFASGSPACLFKDGSFDNLVDPNIQWNLFADVNFDITDTLRYHGELTFTRNILPQVADIVSATFGGIPCVREAPGNTTVNVPIGSTGSSVLGTTTVRNVCVQQSTLPTGIDPYTRGAGVVGGALVNGQLQQGPGGVAYGGNGFLGGISSGVGFYYTPGYNPAVGAFLRTFYDANGTDLSFTSGLASNPMVLASTNCFGNASGTVQIDQCRAGVPTYDPGGGTSLTNYPGANTYTIGTLSGTATVAVAGTGTITGTVSASVTVSNNFGTTVLFRAFQGTGTNTGLSYVGVGVSATGYCANAPGVVTTATVAVAGTGTATVSAVGTFTLPTTGPATGCGDMRSNQIGNVVNQGGRVLLLNELWRPFGWGGNPAFGYQETENRHEFHTFRVVQQLKGSFPEFMGMNIDWDFSGTYTRSTTERFGHSMLIDRLQMALAGFGSRYGDPNKCTASDTSQRTAAGAIIANTAWTRGAGGGAGYATPGNPNAPVDRNRAGFGNGCYYLNPFSSAIRGNTAAAKTINPDATLDANGYPITPGFVGTGNYQGYLPGMGLAHDPALVKWLYAPWSFHALSDFFLLDAVFQGDLGKFVLPGGPISWAGGVQMRYQRNQISGSDLVNRAETPCPYEFGGTINGIGEDINLQSSTATRIYDCVSPAGTLNSANTGPLVYSSGNRSYNNSITQAPIHAVFAELSLPFHDRLNGQLSWRWEKNHRTQAAGDALSANLKFTINDHLSLRVSAGETFRGNDSVAPETLQIDAFTTNISPGTTGAGFVPGSPTTVQIDARSQSNPDLQPETGYNYNAGLIFQTSSVTATIDYYRITTRNRPRGFAATSVTALLFGTNPRIGADTLIDCDSDVFAPQSVLLDDQFNPGASLFSVRNSGGQIVDCQPGVSTLANSNLLAVYQTQVPGNGFETAGVDLGLSWSVPGQVLGGRLQLTSSISYVMQYDTDAFIYQGILIGPAWSGLGGKNFNTSAADGGVATKGFGLITAWRGGFGFNYRHGRHNLNWQSRYVSSIYEDSRAIFGNTNAQTNTNPVDPNTCVFGSSVVPADAGQGILQYNPNCNMSILGGEKIAGIWTTDATYRLSLPAQTTLTVNIQNLFDQEPTFARLGYSFNTYSGPGASGRTIKVQIDKRFY